MILRGRGSRPLKSIGHASSFDGERRLKNVSGMGRVERACPISPDRSRLFLSREWPARNVSRFVDVARTREMRGVKRATKARLSQRRRVSINCSSVHIMCREILDTLHFLSVRRMNQWRQRERGRERERTAEACSCKEFLA